MAKKIVGFIKLQVPAGKANPSPPIGPALGQRGLNIMEFCKAFNAQTQGVDNHHDARCKVVEDGRKNESHKGDAPQQSAFAMRLYGITHKVEPAIGVNNLYDGHRTHEEEQRFGRFAQMFSQAFAHMRQYASSITCQFGHARQNEFGWVNHEKRPTQIGRASCRERV